MQLDAYPGEKRDARPLDSVLVDAPLSSAIEQAVAFIRRNTSHPLKIEGLRRVATELYPQEALREAMVNAVAHRDYENAGVKITVEVFADRVVFSSPVFLQAISESSASRAVKDGPKHVTPLWFRD